MRCVFLVRFDVTQGNVVEWSHPKMPLDGLEFKAIPSGLHALRTDRVFFVQGGSKGVACFNNMPSADAAQRNARMCSVGCLTDDPAELYAVCDQMEAEAKEQNALAERKDKPDYSRLIAIFQSRAGKPLGRLPATPPTSPPSFSSMVQFFGAITFVLWKAMLLKKRILFFSPVPIEQGCMRVRWMEQMLRLLDAGGQVSTDNCIVPAALLYYVNVFDIDELATMSSYVACTSERIFAEKKQLYDVYVNNVRPITPVASH
jgi:hypothetical protein